MSQAGYTPILIYGSSTATAEPTAGNLTSSSNGAELALNYADGKLFYKNSGGNVRLLAIGYGSSTVTPTAGGIQYGTGSAVAFTAAGTAGYLLQSNGSSAPTWVAAPSTSPGGSTTQVQYNNAGAFGGSANFVWDNSNVRLGIGTSSPSTSLHVVGSSSAITATVSSTSTTINGAPSLKVINTGSSTTNQLAEIQFRYEDGTYNANGAIAALRESGTARGQSFIFAPSDSLGNPTERMRIDSSGNVGIGVTPSAWGSFAKALQIGSRTAVYQDTNDAIFSNNAYGATGGNTYIATAAATQYYQSAGTHVWRTAPSGTAGTTITFTERMRIDSSGSVGIGTSSPSDVLTVGGLNAFIRVDRTGNEPGIEFRVSSSTTNRGRIAVTTSGDMYFTSGGATERVRISAAGGFSVGTTADPGAGAIYATGAITAYYSDARLKDVKGTITNALDKVSSLSGVYYTNNEVAAQYGYTSQERQVGLLAQDLEEVLPEVVKAAPFDLDQSGNSKSGEHYKTVQYERVIPLLVEAIKELRAEIKALRG